VAASATNTRSLFRSSAVTSGLVQRERLDEVAAQIIAQTLPPGSTAATAAHAAEVSDKLLAAKLVELGDITRYQAEQLLQGRTRFNLSSYVITDFIGRGGMGDVFKAVHPLMGREVAVKVLTRARATPEAEANFHREIRLQAKLDHPNLVRAHDAGHDGNVYYLVVEFVPGTDLRRLVRNQKKLDMQQAATVIMQAAMGLEHAHAQGLIHRDVKPGNLLVTPDGHTKVSDLGLAGFMHEGQNDPRAGKIVGTADYISPEVFKSPNNVTPVSDIYSLGCTLYYAITGKVPYPGGTTREKLERHCHDVPLHPQRFNESISEEFVEVIADMMEKDPAKRMQSAAECVERLSVWAKGSGPNARSLRSAWSPPPLPNDSGEKGDTAEFELRDAEFAEGSSPPGSLPGEETHSGGRDITSPLPSLSQSDSMIYVAPKLKWAAILITIAITTPLAMFVGAVMMWLFLQLLS
jgi:serine/threonine protein kinase